MLGRRTARGNAGHPDQLTWTTVVCGVLSGAALLMPGLAGAVLAALLMQLFRLFDCVDGGVARWTGFGFRAAESGLGGWAGFNGWVSLGLATAPGVVPLKASTDLVDVARARRGLAVADDEAAAPRSQGVASVRRLAAAFRIHRVTDGIEASLVLLAVAFADAATGSVGPTRWAPAAIAVVTWQMVPAHLLSILSSSRLR
ncbi:CDP-alcohol phosphatidyltransferase family protein [Streptomyces sp. NPDC021608]|uniref:CDP-alcohol phosphatidyltransferase family protein n=1 Tax=Streptomyces sp. NPDC021608 TaxID=3154903 RepID=UPI0033DAD82E